MGARGGRWEYGKEEIGSVGRVMGVWGRKNFLSSLNLEIHLNHHATS